MRPLFLSGNYELTLDDKNRLLIPSEVRKQLDPERDGEAFFCTPGVDGRPWFYPERLYEELVSRDPTDLAPDFTVLDRNRANYGMASRIAWDKQGRILIPPRFLKIFGEETKVTLIGVREHLELWATADWEAECDFFMKRKAAENQRAREARNLPPDAQ